MPVHAQPLPGHALLGVYSRNGGYTDCFMTEIPRAVTHAQYVEAFYTTWVFRLERWILKWAISRPSTDAETDGRMGRAFSALLGFHKLYSRVLVASARRRLGAGRA